MAQFGRNAVDMMDNPAATNVLCSVIEDNQEQRQSPTNNSDSWSLAARGAEDMERGGDDRRKWLSTPSW
jgi:hypothetical protein